MKNANYYYLYRLLGPLNTLMPEEEQAVYAADPNDESTIRQIVRAFIKPFFDSLATASQEHVRDSLSYFLTTKEAPFGDILSSPQDSPLRDPDEPMFFFVSLWKELFSDESYELLSPETWTVRNDFDSATLYLKGHQ